MKYAFLALLLLLAPATALAHQLETDGPIGAVLHIDPSDDPVAGEVSHFYFDFQDRNNVFSLTSCTCTVLIHQGNKELYSEQLSVASVTAAQFVYTFPAKGAYQVHVIGVPTTVGAFPPFNLRYSVRVARDATPPAAIPDWVWALVAAGVVALLTVAGVLSQRSSAPKRGK